MRLDFIKTIRWLDIITIDDYGNKFFNCIITAIDGKVFNYVLSNTIEKWSTGNAYLEEAYYKPQRIRFINLPPQTQCYLRFHALDWNCKSTTGYQAATRKSLGYVLRFNPLTPTDASTNNS